MRHSTIAFALVAGAAIACATSRAKQGSSTSAEATPDTLVHARGSDETAGAMTDRLSILSLKCFHMRQQTLRADVTEAHVQECSAKLARLTEQREDLAACLGRLLAEAMRGDAYFKVYRQFKMYNDPKLNPAIYGEKT